MTDFTPMTPEAAQRWCDYLIDGLYLPSGTEDNYLSDIEGNLTSLGILAKSRGDLIMSHPSFQRPHISTVERGIRQRRDYLVDGEYGLSESFKDEIIELELASDTFAPVIAKIKELFIDGAETQLTRRTPHTQAQAYQNDYAEGLQELSDQLRARINVLSQGNPDSAYDLQSDFIGRTPFNNTLHAKITKLLNEHWAEEKRLTQAEKDAA